MSMIKDLMPGQEEMRTAHIDEAHVGDIKGAWGTIRLNDIAPRKTWFARLLTLLIIMGPGLVTMVGDNDAGGVATYTQAGQNYGTSLLWTLLILIPVLIVNQEMVVRLGAVSRVGHARLIFERFGKFWGAFSVIDLFILNFLTIVTEFIGFSMALNYFGVSPYISVPIGVAGLIAITVTGSFRRWESVMWVCCITSLLMIPIALIPHPALGPIVHDTFIPSVTGGLNSTALLTIIAIVGTTVAPWQLFFQQSNVVDKRITARWAKNERADTIIGAFLTNIEAAGLIIDYPAQCEHHRGLRGLALDILRLWRRLQGQSLAASEGERSEVLLRQLCRARRAGRGNRADPQRAARLADLCGAGPGGDSAAERHGLPGVAVQ